MDGYSNRLNCILRERAHHTYCTNDMYNALKDSLNVMLRMDVVQEINGHEGCVNSVRWNSEGSLLLTGSDDKLLNIYRYPNYELCHSIPSGHRSNIFNARFLPFSNDSKICSCSNDGAVIYNDLNQARNYGTCIFKCHKGIVYDVMVHNHDPYGMMSCGEDGKVRYFDLRIKSKCDCNCCTKSILINTMESVNALAINPYNVNEIATGCGDGTIRVFDRRAIFGQKNRILRSYSERATDYYEGLLYCYRYVPTTHSASSSVHGDRITCLLYNHSGSELLASYAPDTLLLFSTNPKRNVSAMEISSARKALKDKLYLLPGDLRNVNVDSKKLKLVRNEKLPFRGSLKGRILDTNHFRYCTRTERNHGANSYNNASDDQTGNFRRVIEPVSYEFGSEASTDNQSRRNFSIDNDFSSETIPLLGRRRNFLDIYNGVVDHTDPLQRNESTQDYDDNPAVFGDASYPLRKMKRFLNVLRDESSGILFDLPENSFCNLYDESVVEQSFTYDRLRCYLDSIFVPEYVKYYRGHRNIKTMIKECNYYGNKYIISGSDCGNVFAWDIDTCEVVNIFKGDGNIVNSVQPHPEQPIIACSGIDNTTKIIAPKRSRPLKNPKCEQIIRSNSGISTRRTYRFRRYDLSPSMVFQVLLAMEHSDRAPAEIFLQSVHNNDGTIETFGQDIDDEPFSPTFEQDIHWNTFDIPPEYVQYDNSFSLVEREQNDDLFDESSFAGSNSQSSSRGD